MTRSYIVTIHHDSGFPSHARVDASSRADALKQGRVYAKRIGVKPGRIVAGLSGASAYIRRDGRA